MKNREPDSGAKPFVAGLLLLAACNYGEADDPEYDTDGCNETDGNELVIGDSAIAFDDYPLDPLHDCNDGAVKSDHITTHSILLHTKEILAWAQIYDQRVTPADSASWGPLLSSSLSPEFGGSCVPMDLYPFFLNNMFCAGHTHLRDGRILVGGGGGGSGGDRTSVMSIFDPSTYEWSESPAMNTARWYPSMITLHDGRVAALGGAAGPPNYCRSGQCWPDGRTCIDDLDCDPFCDNGTCSHNENTCSSDADCQIYQTVLAPRAMELFDPDTNQWEYATNEIPAAINVNYPNIYLLPNGKVFYAGQESEVDLPGGAIANGHTFDPQTRSWESFSADSSVGLGGVAVQYEPGKIMRSGGSIQASAGTEFIDLSEVDGGNPNEDWDTLPGELGEMCHPRHLHSLVLLADGRVMAVGGNLFGNSETGDNSENSCDDAEVSCCTPGPDGEPQCSNSACANDSECMPFLGVCNPRNNACFGVMEIEIWDPVTKLWSKLVDGSGTPVELNRARMYHHTVLLMPDGRVSVMGGGNRGGLEDHSNREIITPAYLEGDPSRPQLSFVSGESTLAYGACEQRTVQLRVVGSEPSRVTALKLGSVTHNYDADARFLELCSEDDLEPCQLAQAPNGDWIVTAPLPCPANDDQLQAAIAPPGHYMVFVFDDAGVPSEAEILRIDTPEFAGQSSWHCGPSLSFHANEATCDTPSSGGICSPAHVNDVALSLPETGMGNGWEVVAKGNRSPPGLKDDGAARTLGG